MFTKVSYFNYVQRFKETCNSDICFIQDIYIYIAISYFILKNLSLIFFIFVTLYSVTSSFDVAKLTRVYYFNAKLNLKILTTVISKI